jgi:hypothetical protein
MAFIELGRNGICAVGFSTAIHARVEYLIFSQFLLEVDLLMAM